MKIRALVVLVLSLSTIAVTAAADSKLKVVSASYFSADKSCNATAFVAARCDGLGNCEFTPSNAMCGDPRENYAKSLTVTYTCDGVTRDVTVGEADRVILTCAGVEMPVMRLHERFELEGARMQRKGEYRIDIPTGYHCCRHEFMNHSAAPLGRVQYEMTSTSPDFVFSYDVPCAGVNAGKLLGQSGNARAEAFGKFFEEELACVGGGDSWLRLGISVQVAKDGVSCPSRW